ncbi:ABC transporter permease [bacterium]|nr:ABC transporter permease [bacterium]
MIRFLIKGLFRDRHRSLFPVITVTVGVTITVVLHCWITGVMGDFIDFNARFTTGHVKVVTRAYAENLEQRPIDLALLDTKAIVDSLKEQWPGYDWVQRIGFGGILDAPDSLGETRAQGPAMGFGIDLLSPETDEIGRMGIRDGLASGKLPERPGDILISDQFAHHLGVGPGDRVTLLTSTMYGAMAMQNFTIAGTVNFGIELMDRGAMIADLSDMQATLDMQDAAGEILGIAKNHRYQETVLAQMSDAFNKQWTDPEDEFSAVMLPLYEQNNLKSLIEYTSGMIGLMIFVFVLAMCVVLWNAGLIGGLRRYGEIGVRLAIGENKGHLYRAMILESVAIGICGTIAGTAIGLGLSWLLQTYGINVGDVMKNATMMIPDTFRADITPPAYFIGFIPGLFATVVGTSLSGIGIYRRQTASLFKELEA